MLKPTPPGDVAAAVAAIHDIYEAWAIWSCAGSTTRRAIPP